MAGEIEAYLRLEIATWIIKAERHLDAALAVHPFDASDNFDMHATLHIQKGRLDVLRSMLEVKKDADAVTLAGLLADVAELSGKAEMNALAMGWVKALLEVKP